MSQPTCAHCNTPSLTLKRCSDCKRVSYCNKACQKGDWKSHKTVCKIEPQAGDFVDVAIPLSDPSKPRRFPTFEEASENGELKNVPRECCTTRRRADGSMIVFVSEDKWQGYQAREAEKKAAKAAQTEAMYEESVLDGGDDKEENK